LLQINCKKSQLSLFACGPPSLTDFSRILTIKLGPTDIILKMMFFWGEEENKYRSICYQFECSILYLCCYLAKFRL